MAFTSRARLGLASSVCTALFIAATGCGSEASDDDSPSVGATGGVASGGTGSGGEVGSVGGTTNSGTGANGSGATTGTGSTAGSGSGGSTSGGGGASATGGEGTGTGGTAVVEPPPPPDGFYQMEDLDRGLVAVKVTGGVYLSWRMQGYEYDAENPERVSYDVYRDGTLLAHVSNSTNYLDATGTASSSYTVRAILGDYEGEPSGEVKAWASNYLRIPIQKPSDIYSANDASPGDVDGDGQYEIILKWDPNNSKDNSQSGVTGNVYLDCLKLDGTRLWRVDLGPNIRAGAHYTQFVVQDFDGDGKAELAVKTAPGTKDGTGAFLSKGPASNDDDGAVYRNSGGYILTGPEYLTVFSGATGAELATVNFDVPRGTVSAWGDSYGNRVDRFLATAAYLDDTGIPSFIMARGYYTRSTLTAWNFRDGQLKQLWKFDSNQTPKDAAGHPYTGQGSHSMAVANVDDDPGQEVMYGAMAVDDDGAGLCSTGYGHGDAEHVSDLVPSRPGLEFFMCHEDKVHPAYHLRDARTCQILQQGPVNGTDTGRCVADDILASNDGAEMWTTSTDGLISSANNQKLDDRPGPVNFVIYWDGDETRELEDGTSITKYDGGTLQTCDVCASNNSTKATPTLTADLLGDWREEVIWREADNSALRLYTTTALTERRLFTLMHDPQYRMQVSGEQTAYNQPPHVGFHIGHGMVTPAAPDIHLP